VLAGHTPLYFTVTAAVYVTFVIGDLIAIPFGYVFAGEAKAQTS